MTDFTYYNTVDQLFHAEWTARKLGRLALVRKWTAELWPGGHSTALIQVGGTSGKGSVVRFLEAGLALDGATGSMTSPHIYDYRERYRVNGQTAAAEDITRHWEALILPLCIRESLRREQDVPSFHEIMVLMALALFEQHNIQWGAVEVGIGGRYDQTTALDYAAALLTNVGSDHERLLGAARWQRALDKAGIARPGVPLITTVQEAETLAVLRDAAGHVGAPLLHVTAAEVEAVAAQLDALFPGGLPAGALLNVAHQHWNAALALRAIEHLLPGVAAGEVLRQFAAVQFEGRFQQVGAGIYADIAHNPDKIAALVRQIDARLPEAARRIFVVALSGTRSAAEVFPPLLESAAQVIVTSTPRHGIPPEDVAAGLAAVNRRGVPVEVEPEPRAALERAKALQGPGDVIILTGSTYMLDAALNPDPYLRHLNATHGWRDEIRTLK